jgi:hypothetical protein
MAIILSTSQITNRFLDFYKIAQPNLDTKPGTVARDLLIDSISIRIAETYNELLRVSNSQSITNSVGEDLDNLGGNFNVPRASAGAASGTALLTFNSIGADITVASGALVYARNGVSFRIISGVVISAANEAQYKALATTYRDDLDFVGITDNYAIEVVVEAVSAGIQGNISKYGLVSVSIPGISNVTNVSPFIGGSPVQNDASYSRQILSVFSGSNTGTELGYENLVLENSSVLDAIVVVPGDPLMTRDGSIQETNENGELVLTNGEPTIISEGTGGKVDIFVYGRRLGENLDSYIYNDKSGKSDATQSINDYTIGQISGDSNKTVTRRRLENIKNGALPNQPIINILEVIGSRSGTFSPQIIDEYGNSTGNYTLLKDTGVFAESAWGQDKLSWVSNSVNRSENLSKNVFNGQDTLLYSDVTNITQINRVINVINENSTVKSLNSQLQLSHTPVRSVNRVLNVTTGERYVVSDRNPNGSSGDLNTDGIITISGKNLPSSSDTLQVDYEWIFYHDSFVDFDSIKYSDNPRIAIDTVDWGYSNAIRREEKTVQDGYTVTVTHNISSVISVNKVVTETSTVSLSTSGDNLVVQNLNELVQNVVSIKKLNGAEVYNTNEDNGSFDSNRIILPTDTSAQVGDSVVITYNAFDLFNINGNKGTFSNNIITLVQDAKNYISIYSTVEVNYIANVTTLLPTTNISELPATKNVNGFSLNGSTSIIGTQPITNIYSGSLVTKNLRKSPTRLNINVAGTSEPGLITISGETVKLLQNVVISSISSGLTQDLSLAIKQGLGLSLTSALSSKIKLARLVSFEKVETSNDVVTNVLQEYDIIGYSLNDNSYDIDTTVKDSSLSSTKVVLPTTVTNVANQPLVGDKIRVTMYVVTNDDEENISFSTNGSIYSDKKFGYIDSILVSSGFKTGSTIQGSLTISPMNQPNSGNRYSAIYTYTAPKNGERISIRYNTNELIEDLTLGIESSRSVTADVLIKSASSILIDITATISVLSEFSNTKIIVGQNVGDKISNYINNLDLGSTLHPSDITNVAYQVNGLDSIVIERFNVSTKTGNTSAITALKNQYMQANNINIKV